MNIEERLKEENFVIYNTQGNSMCPMLVEGRDKAVISKPVFPLKKYDVPVYRRGDHYTMHRIIKVTKKGYLICGDNRTHIERDITDKDIVGVLTAFYHNGSLIKCTDKGYLRYAKKTCRKLPFKIIKKFFGKVGKYLELKENKTVFLRHVTKYFITNIVPAFIFALLFAKNIIPSKLGFVALAMMLSIIGCMVYNSIRLSRYVHRTSDLKRYFTVKIAAFIPFFVVNMIMAILNAEPVYTYLFMQYKFLTLFGVSKVLSALLINMLMLVPVFMTPLINLSYLRRKKAKKAKRKAQKLNNKEAKREEI